MGNEVRGIGWGLRNLVDAAAYLPDLDPLKACFARKVANNQADLDAHANILKNPLGVTWEDGRPENTSRLANGNPAKWIAMWEQNYVAWAIDHANRQGFSGGLVMRDRLTRFVLALFTSPGYPREYACPYVLAVGKAPGGAFQWFMSFGQVFSSTYGSPPGPPTPITGYYGVDYRLVLQIAISMGLPGGQEAYDWLHPQIAVAGFVLGPNGKLVSDLANRAGWALAPEVTPPAATSAPRQRK